ncbi:MAG: SDR family oxidoreductase [Rhodospirillaceae bacterium]|jgi:3-oxoacyl-[acyl-carrier protein] reductase|nr:SDR family oxidoreductase [Rhodospirillaceae bacterium]MBT5458719.1 SDR family oxidoreductase [Rhodospirillaceae bacterium]
MSEQQRIILITGAASGIGAAACRHVAGPGVRLLLHTRKNEAALQSVAEAARAAGAEAVTQLGDLTDPDVPGSLVAAAVDAFGGLDQIVANAGFAQRGGINDVGIDDLIQAERCMPDAFFLFAKAAITHLESSAWGRVVAVSSFVAHAFSDDPKFTTTGAAKAAMEALAKSLAIDLAPAGVTVNCVAPGFTSKDATGHSAMSEESRAKSVSGRVPLGRIGTPDDIGAAIRFLLSRDASYITGQTLHVDGGLTLG